MLTWPLARLCLGEAPVPSHPWGTLECFCSPEGEREVLGKHLKEANGKALLVLCTAPCRREGQRVREAAGLLLSPSCPKASHLFSCVRRDDRWAEGTL